MYHITEKNDDLRQELHHKISVYAAYLPPTVYIKSRMEDGALAETNEGQQPVYAPGEDPITCYEREIATLKEGVANRENEIDSLKAERELNYVRKEEKEVVEEQLQDSQVRFILTLSIEEKSAIQRQFSPSHLG